MEYLSGIHPVLEALKKGDRVERVLIKRGIGGVAITQILELAKGAQIPVEVLNQRDLEELIGTTSHQGVAAMARSKGYLSLLDLHSLLQKEEVPLVVILDQIQDPQNLGAIIRSSCLLGAHAVIIPKDRSASLTGAVYRAAAGAVEHVPLVQVTNIAKTLETLKEWGLWIAGAVSQGGVPIFSQDLKGPLGVVIGNEGRGLRPLVQKRCDFLLHIPVLLEMDSLNASVATGIFLYEIRRQSLIVK